MRKKLSSGIIVKCKDKYVIGHLTEKGHYDIFKGGSEPHESLMQAAIRECMEESSLVFTGKQLSYLGLYDYTVKKDLALFITKIDNVDIDDLHCKVIKDDTPEMDFYELVTFEEMLSKVTKSMKARLLFLQKEIKAF